MVCEVYRRQGYDFIAVTDHFSPEFEYPVTDTRPYRTDDFTTLIAAELHAPALDNGQEWHILACGLPLDFAAPSNGETGPELAARANAAGAFVGLAHPQWYGASIADLQSIEVAHAIEAYNEVCAGISDRADSWYHVDQLLASGRRVTAFGADDAHFRDFTSLQKAVEDGLELGRDSDGSVLKATGPAPDGSGSGDTFPAGFAAWVWVHADRLDPDLLVESLKAGDYYTSQGPRIHDISLNEDRTELSVVCSPAVSVFVTGNPANFTFGANHAKHITRSSFPVAGHHGSYCRVTVLDAAGRRAWTNPIWLD